MKKKIVFFLPSLFFIIMITIILYLQEVNAANGTTYALLISGESRDGSETDADVRNMIDRINSNRLEQYPGKPIYTTLNYNGLESGVAEKELENHIKIAYKNAKENDFAIFFYSGHGNQKNGKGVGITISKEYYYTYENLAQLLSKNIKCKKIMVVINACYSGGFYDSGVSQLADKSRFIVFLSSQAWQISQGGGYSGVSRFGRTFVNGLGCPSKKVYADFDNDGKVTVQEMKTYLDIQLRADLIDNNVNWNDQNPIYYATDNNFVIYQYDNSSVSKSLVINKRTLNLWKGQSITLSATKNNISGEVKWTTNNSKIATVSKKGKVTAKGVGQAIITANVNSMMAKCIVIVKPSIQINKTNVTIYTSGTKTVQLKATVNGKIKRVVWETSNKKIASVDKNGKVTAKKVGAVKVTAKANGEKAICEITVKKPEKPTISLDKSDIVLYIGGTCQLKATVKNSSSVVTWTSSDSAIAIVDCNGNVKGKKKGIIYITASVKNANTKCKITVNEEKILASKISAGGKTSALVKSDGSLWIWGDNWYGQTGLGEEHTYYELPQKLMSNVSKVVLGASHSAAITKDKKLYLWGGNWHGQLGDGTTTNRYEPVYITNNVSDVSLGSVHTAILKTDGSLYMCGYNTYAQIDDTHQDIITPKKILQNVKQVSLGGETTAIIKSDNSLWVWGMNGYGQVGNGKTSYRVSEPTRILNSVADISLGEYFSAALLKDGSLYTWGRNYEGQLGQGASVSYNPNPTKIMTSVKSISMGKEHGMAIKDNGTLFSWGKILMDK